MVTSPHALPTGFSLQEYRIDELLGVGGFGLTYLATDANLNLRVAIKEFLPSQLVVREADQSLRPRGDDAVETFDWGRRRFLDESRTLASFRHPNIVRVMRFFEANGTAYMVMEFVEGASLPEWIKTRRPLPQPELLGLAGPLLDGLAAVHSTGYLHRDIKPGNIYVRSDGSPVLLDFGSARMAAQDAELTAVVSPGFAPLEQYHSTGNQGPWTDLYAFGGVLYWILTGRKPVEAAARVRADSMPPAVQAADRRAYDGALLAAIDWALAVHEGDRPQSVADLMNALPMNPVSPPSGGRATGRAETLARTGSAAASTSRLAEQTRTTSAVTFDRELLTRIESEVVKHIGPIAGVVVKTAARRAIDVRGLVEAVSTEIADDKARAAFVRRFSEDSQPVSQRGAERSQPVSQWASGRSQTVSQSRSAPSQPVSASAPRTGEVSTRMAQTRFDAAILDNAEKRLAQYIGAVARVVVKRAAMKARDEGELYLLIADEIDDKAERKAFVRAAISVSGKR